MNTVLTSTHNICFRTEIRKSFIQVNLIFPNIKWDLHGCSYHKLVKRCYVGWQRLWVSIKDYSLSREIVQISR